MKARKKEIKEVPVADLGVDIPRLKVLKMEPPKKEAGKKWRPCRNCSTFCT
jgi:electron transfer flavoprotein alpha/beta subunit